LEVLKRLREKVKAEMTRIFADKSWILHYNNAPAHTALSVGEFFASKQITVLEHPSYSPELTPNESFLFPKIKKILNVRHFDDIDDIRRDLTAALRAIPQNQLKIVLKGGLGAGIGA
jgi:transposase